ncbi:MAG: nickel pincer cofactor biosynthesis protein LarC [bacterium]|nr:nickel pincer cofactor biosynthesis protein LarC [bacterium]
MLLGALLDVGASARQVREQISCLGVDGIRMRVSNVKRGAIAARYVQFRGPARDSKQRRWAEIRKLISKAPLRNRVRERSLEVFEALAESEARVHGVAPERVHFHEVGAIDAIGDIVGVCAALDALEVSHVSSSPLALGHGQVKTEHGVLPLPAPASLLLLAGIPTYPVDVPWETVTPTGAALLRVLVDEWGPMPAITPLDQGFGAGQDRSGPMPNTLRVALGVSNDALARDTVSVIETHLDDTHPEHLPFLLERLMEDGALDASLSSLTMKKGRMGQLLRVLARPSDRDRLARRVLLESSALGVRFSELPRLLLKRENLTVQTDYGAIRVKIARAPDGATSAAPEYEACARAARKHSVPLGRVYRAAERRAEEELS